MVNRSTRLLRSRPTKSDFIRYITARIESMTSKKTKLGLSYYFSWNIIPLTMDSLDHENGPQQLNEFLSGLSLHWATLRINVDHFYKIFFSNAQRTKVTILIQENYVFKETSCVSYHTTFQKKRREKSSASLLLVVYFRIILNNYVVRLSAVILLGSHQSRSPPLSSDATQISSRKAHSSAVTPLSFRKPR